nr:hypothetical protein [Allomuricauda sp.]
MLLKKMLADFPEDKTNRSSALQTLGEICRLKGEDEKALEYFKKSIDFEKEFPNVKTGSYLDYAELIVKMGKEEHFDEIENLLTDNLDMLSFPNQKYLSFSLLSFLNANRGFTELAEEYYELAELNASAKTSGFRYHKDLGLVKKRDVVLDKIVKEEKTLANKGYNSLWQKVKSKLNL